MTRGRVLVACLAVTFVVSAALATGASATSPLILKVGGVAAPDGSRASGKLDLTCAHLVFGGTLTVNGEPTDRAVFTEGGGTDTCEGGIVWTVTVGCTVVSRVSVTDGRCAAQLAVE